MDISDIVKSMEQMSEKELFDTLQEIRLSRRTSKRVAGKIRATSTKKDVNLDTLLSTLSKTDISTLLEAMQKGGADDSDEDGELE